MNLPARKSSVVLQPEFEHVELVERVYLRLKEMIFDQELKPGQKILQEKVAAQLGVSRSPLLKALHRLENEMLVESIPRRGMFVKEMELAEVIDIFQCRAVLEGLSTRLAAERISPGDVKKLRELFLPFAGQEVIDRERYANADRKFHDRLMRLSGNQVIDRLEMLSNIHLLAFQVGLLRPPESTLTEHFAIIDALEAGDGRLAEERMRAHIDESRLAMEQQHKR
jgi:DNA-binding GntR family transcriptional regulator